MNIDNLLKLLKQNSFSSNPAGVNKKIEMIKQMLADLPFEWTHIPSQGVKVAGKAEKIEYMGDYVYGFSKEMDPEKPVVGLMLHVDTVHPPEVDFEVKQVGDKLYGPGANDMQGGIFVVIEVLKKLHEQGLFKNIILILNPCEELGSPEFSSETAKLAKKIDYCLVYEDTGKNLKEGEQGFLKEFGLVVERKGTFEYKIGCYGPGGHSGVLTQKEQRKNAISHATRLIADIEALADYERGTTINIQCINGGQPATIIAQDCEFQFDVRYRFEEEKKRVVDCVKKLLQKDYIPGVEVKDYGFTIDLPPLPPNQNSQEFFEQVKKVAAQNNLSVFTEKRGGWSDACNIYHYNKNCKVLDGFAPKGNGEHTKNEFLYIDSIKPAIDLSYNVLRELIG